MGSERLRMLKDFVKRGGFKYTKVLSDETKSAMRMVMDFLDKEELNYEVDRVLPQNVRDFLTS